MGVIFVIFLCPRSQPRLFSLEKRDFISPMNFFLWKKGLQTQGPMNCTNGVLALVIGLPACGKTTFCKQIAAACVERGIDVVHVEYDRLILPNEKYRKVGYGS